MTAPRFMPPSLAVRVSEAAIYFWDSNYSELELSETLYRRSLFRVRHSSTRPLKSIRFLYLAWP